MSLIIESECKGLPNYLPSPETIRMKCQGGTVSYGTVIHDFSDTYSEKGFKDAPREQRHSLRSGLCSWRLAFRPEQRPHSLGTSCTLSPAVLANTRGGKGCARRPAGQRTRCVGQDLADSMDGRTQHCQTKGKLVSAVSGEGTGGRLGTKQKADTLHPPTPGWDVCDIL